MSRHDLTFAEGVDLAGVAASIQSLAAEGPQRAGRRRPPISIETHLGPGRVQWQVVLPPHLARSFKRTCERSLPGTTFTPADTSPIRFTYGVELRLSSRERLLDIDHAEAVAARLLAVANDLGRGEHILIQWQIGGPMVRRVLVPAAPAQERSIWNLPDWRNQPASTEALAAARKKQASHVFAAVGRIAVVSARRTRSRQLVAAVLGNYQLLRVPGAGLRRRSISPSHVVRRLHRFRPIPLDPPVQATAAELAAMIGWPISNPPAPGVRYERAPKRPMDPRVLQPAGSGRRILGVSGYPADDRQLVSLSVSDGLRHTHLIGPTGVGKSTLLASMALAEIHARRGVVVIDIKGDLIPDILDRIPERLQANVAILDPTDEAPIGFNPLESGAAVGIDGLLHVLRSTWANSWGPRLDDILSSSIRTLALTPGHTLAELPLLLTDLSFRRPLVERAVATDPLALGTFWPAFDAASDELRAQMLAPVMNKLRALLVHPPLRAVLGQSEPRFDLNRVFTERQALLVRLPKGEIGLEASRLLSGMLLAHLWRLALARTRLPPERRSPVLIVVDEVQDTLRLSDLADGLVQARGAGVGLVLAHQHLDQLDKATRSAVLANAGSRILFRLDHDDATLMARRSGGDLKPEHLAHLAAFEAYASIMTDGEPTPFGSLRTLPLPPASADRAALLLANRERYGFPYSEVERRLRRQAAGAGGRSPMGLLGSARAEEGTQ